MPATKFDHTVTVSFRWVLIESNPDDMVRGTFRRPMEAAKRCGCSFSQKVRQRRLPKKQAQNLWDERLDQEVPGGFQDFDVAIATPAAME